MLLSDRSRFVINPIEEENIIAQRLENSGKKIYRLNRGDPTKYFPTPKYIIDAHKRALDEGYTYYSNPDGINELKNAVIKRYSRLYKLSLAENDVVVTEGVSESLLFLNSAIINPLDLAVIFKPYYPLYNVFLNMNSGKAVEGDYDEQNNWDIDVEKLKKSLEKVKRDGKIRKLKYMIITNPNNPTGTVINKAVLKEIVDIANEYGILLISDEIYDEIVFNKVKYTSVSEVARGIPYVILGGISKVYNATGFRIGFSIIPENDEVSGLLKGKIYDYASTRISAGMPAQFAAATAMNNVKEHSKSLNAMVKTISERVNHAAKMINECKNLETVIPNGAFYVFPKINLNDMDIKDDREFVMKLLKEKGVLVTRGSGFGSNDHFRVVALAPKETLDEAISKINSFCKTHSKN